MTEPTQQELEDAHAWEKVDRVSKHPEVKALAEILPMDVGGTQEGPVDNILRQVGWKCDGGRLGCGHLSCFFS